MMRRRKIPEPEPPRVVWVLSFADLTMLLLTFFLLLVSMSSLTVSSFMSVNSFMEPKNFISSSGAGKVPKRIQLVLKAIKDPETFESQKKRIKDILFPEDKLPAEIPKSTLEKNLEVLQTKEGIAVILNSGLLFEPGSYTLNEAQKKLLSSLQEVILYSNADVNIAGYTDNDPTEGFTGDRKEKVDSYELSGFRALAVLEYFLVEKSDMTINPSRLSISAYGPDRPVTNDTSDEGRARNRRIEILLKNEQSLGGPGGYN